MCKVNSLFTVHPPFCSYKFNRSGGCIFVLVCDLVTTGLLTNSEFAHVVSGLSAVAGGRECFWSGMKICSVSSNNSRGCLNLVGSISSLLYDCSWYWSSPFPSGNEHRLILVVRWQIYNSMSSVIIFLLLLLKTFINFPKLFQIRPHGSK